MHTERIFTCPFVDCYSLVSGLVKGVVMSRPDDNDLLTVQEVARQYRADDTTVRRWIKSSTLEAVTLLGRGKRQVHRAKKSAVPKCARTYEKFSSILTHDVAQRGGPFSSFYL